MGVNGVWAQVFLIFVVVIQGSNGMERFSIWWDTHIGSPNYGIKIINLEKTRNSWNWPPPSVAKIVDQKWNCCFQRFRDTEVVVSPLPLSPARALQTPTESRELQGAAESLTRWHYNHSCWAGYGILLEEIKQCLALECIYWVGKCILFDPKAWGSFYFM